MHVLRVGLTCLGAKVASLYTRFCSTGSMMTGTGAALKHGLLCVQRADLHGRAQDVLKRKLNVTLPELEMPEVLFFSRSRPLRHFADSNVVKCSH